MDTRRDEPIEPARWHRIEELFAGAIELGPGSREGYLDEACAGDSALRAEVAAMLAADAGADPLLDEGAVLRAAEIPPERIGPYQVAGALGGGGMGQVFLGRRSDGHFEQEVAIKVIRPELVSRALLGRFAVERRILARLSHPNIARLLNGGVTGDGRPWFSMERVEGVPIDEHCRRRGLGVRERARLFRDVCAAVKYAHSMLVVHRDLKPANVLVTADGQVKLLDFGIAKVLEPAPGPGITRTTDRVMTPEYAAPEQIRGEPVTTATDVYALGGLLYELIAGQRPFRSGASPADLERAICETPPARPSSVVRGLDRDLDSICLAALRKEPERRYGSAAELADDVDRYLALQPVRARKDTLRYRAGKFVRRNAAVVAVAAASVLALGAVTTAYAMGIARESDRVRTEAAKARQIALFLEDLFKSSDPDQARGSQVTARALLDRGRRRISGELALQPAVRGDLMAVMGKAYQNLGLFDDAGALLDEALRIERARGDAAGIARLADQLGGVRRDQARFDEAERLVREGLALRRGLGRDVADSLESLGDVLRELGRYGQATAAYEEALARRRKQGAPAAAIADSLSDVALGLMDGGEYAPAAARYREALALHESALGADHPKTIGDVHDLADALRKEGKLEEAEGLYRQALAGREKIYGEQHPDTANTINHLARLLYQRGRLEESEKLFRRSVAVHRALYGDSNPAVAAALGGLAGVLLKRGHPEGAEPLYREGLSIVEKIFGHKHPYVAAFLSSLGRVAWARHDAPKAIRLFRESLALNRTLLHKGHVDLAHPLIGLGIALRDTGDAQSAEPLLKEAAGIRKAALPASHPFVVEANVEWAACLARLGRYAEAEALLLESERATHGTIGARPALLGLISLYGTWGRKGEAVPWRDALARLPVEDAAR